MAVCLPLPSSLSLLPVALFLFLPVLPLPLSPPAPLLSLPVCSASSSLGFSLSDKLDEILAAAQQTISTNDTAATRGPAGPKRDRGRSFYSNEVCLSISLFVRLSLPQSSEPIQSSTFHNQGCILTSFICFFFILFYFQCMEKGNW